MIEPTPASRFEFTRPDEFTSDYFAEAYVPSIEDDVDLTEARVYWQDDTWAFGELQSRPHSLAQLVDAHVNAMLWARFWMVHAPPPLRRAHRARAIALEAEMDRLMVRLKRSYENLRKIEALVAEGRAAYVRKHGRGRPDWT
jgi:hypothetical protein